MQRTLRRDDGFALPERLTAVALAVAIGLGILPLAHEGTAQTLACLLERVGILTASAGPATGLTQPVGCGGDLVGAAPLVPPEDQVVSQNPPAPSPTATPPPGGLELPAWAKRAVYQCAINAGNTAWQAYAITRVAQTAVRWFPTDLPSDSLIPSPYFEAWRNLNEQLQALTIAGVSAVFACVGGVITTLLPSAGQAFPDPTPSPSRPGGP